MILNISYVLADIFNAFLKEPYSPHYGKVSCMVPEFKNVRKMSVAKNERPVSLYSVVSKPSENSKMIGLFISTRVIAFVIISRMVSGLLVLCWSFNRSLLQLLGYLAVWDETNYSNYYNFAFNFVFFRYLFICLNVSVYILMIHKSS